MRSIIITLIVFNFLHDFNVYACSGFLQFAGPFSVVKLDRQSLSNIPIYPHYYPVKKLLIASGEGLFPAAGDFEAITSYADTNHRWAHFVVALNQSNQLTVGQFWPLDKQARMADWPGNAAGTISVVVGSQANLPFTEVTQVLTQGVQELWAELAQKCTSLPVRLDQRVIFGDSDWGYGEFAPSRLSIPAYYDVSGVVGLQHVPNNVNWGPGHINAYALMRDGSMEAKCAAMQNGKYCASDARAVWCSGGIPDTMFSCERTCDAADGLCVAAETLPLVVGAGGACNGVDFHTGLEGDACCARIRGVYARGRCTVAGACASGRIFMQVHGSEGCDEVTGATDGCCVDHCEGVEPVDGEQTEGGDCCLPAGDAWLRGTCESSCTNGEFHRAFDGAKGCETLPAGVRCCIPNNALTTTKQETVTSTSVAMSSNGGETSGTSGVTAASTSAGAQNTDTSESPTSAAATTSGAADATASTESSAPIVDDEALSSNILLYVVIGSALALLLVCAIIVCVCVMRRYGGDSRRRKIAYPNLSSMRTVTMMRSSRRPTMRRGSQSSTRRNTTASSTGMVVNRSLTSSRTTSQGQIIVPTIVYSELPDMADL